MKSPPSSKSKANAIAPVEKQLPAIRPRPPRTRQQSNADIPQPAEGQSGSARQDPPKPSPDVTSQANPALIGPPVGYKKPPVHTQFKKGISGNPKGRVKGGKNIWTILQEEAQAVVSYSENGKPTKASKQTLAIKSAFNKAVKGDLRALQLLMKLFEKYAPAHQAIEAEGSQTQAERQKSDRQVLDMLGLLSVLEPPADEPASAQPAPPSKPPTQH